VVAFRLRLGKLTIFSAIAVLASPAFGVSAEPFYKDKTIRILTSEVGSGYDASARLVARHLGDHIEGHPAVIVQAMPGATIKIPLYLAKVVATDSTVIGALNNAAAFAPALGIPQADFDPTKLQWLGSPSTEVGMALVWHTAPVDTIADATKRQLLMGVGGDSSSATFYARLLNEVLGVKFKLVSGYAGMGEAFLAMERGEIDGFPSTLWNSLRATKPEWIADKKIKILVQYGRRKIAELPDVPAARDLARNDGDRMLIDAAAAPLDMGRPFAMPPDAAPENVRTVRAAMMATFTDPAFIADAKSIRFDTDKTPRSGDDLLATVIAVYQAPPSVRERLQALYKQR
jgi:tripartite-type tricarboxylate transporter receptor subunit TctC